MEYKLIEYYTEGKLAYLKLNTPERLNAIRMETYDEILDALNRANEDINVKVLVLCAEGSSFCGGGDIADMKKSVDLYGHARFNIMAKKAAEISNVILKMEKPVIAAVQGAIAGAAFNIVLACDIVICASDAKFIQAFVQIGLIPDAGGVYILSKAVGTSLAKELCFSARQLRAEEAKNLGIVSVLCDSDDLMKEAKKTALKYASGPTEAYGRIKRLMYRANYYDFEEYIEQEIQAQVDMGETDNFKEGINAFIEKRRPEFK